MPRKEARIIIITDGGRVGWGKKEPERKGGGTEREPKELFSTFITIKT